MPSSSDEGVLYTWGRGSDGQLGQSNFLFPKSKQHANCALPHPVPSLGVQVVHVDCGPGQQGCTAAVTADGALWTFGNNYKGRLGHGVAERCVRKPRRVAALRGTHVACVACGAEHMLALDTDARVWSWGSNNRGCLGRPKEKQAAHLVPGLVDVLSSARIVRVAAETNTSAAVTSTGHLLTWGSNAHGNLGVGDRRDRDAPTQVEALAGAVAEVSLGSLYSACTTIEGQVWTWGHGGHGNLGLGTRKSHASPQQVVGFGGGDAPFGRAAAVAATTGQPGCKGGLKPRAGAEGPHTLVVTTEGAVYTFGTCHKGLCGNLGNKDGAFGKPWDELRPYRLGDALRNGKDKPPLSPFACWPPPYDRALGRVVSAVSAHIHAAVLNEAGELYAWGCGSNDGRCGVERFLNMRGEGKPPAVDAMKCYLMGPHRVGYAREKYWAGGPSLRGMRVVQVASGRNHMAAIVVAGAPPPPRPVGGGGGEDGGGGGRSVSTAAAEAKE